MKSVRLDPLTEVSLEMAAKARGVSESEFIRQAIRRETEATFGETLDQRISDVVGTIRSKGGRAKDSHSNFSKLLSREQKKRRR